MLRNTVIFAGSVTVISLFFDSMAAYAFSRMHFRGKKVIFNVILLTMMVPFQVIMIPLYLEEFNLGILNTYAGLILPRAAECLRHLHADFVFREHPEITGRGSSH